MEDFDDLRPAHEHGHEHQQQLSAGSMSIECPNCLMTVDIDEAQRRALDELVRSEVDSRVKLLLAEAERNAAASASQQVELALARARAEHAAVLAERDAELSALKSESALKVERAVAALMLEKAELVSALDSSRLMHEVQLSGVRERYEAQLAERDEAIERLRDMKLKLSTKMVGETLEQHCETEFEKIRALAFGGDGTSVQFGKDNDASSGSKGDYVFREHDAATGAELVSILFEMKNEQTEGDLASPKHRNVEFLSKLDKDRREKGCEYAVLVSMLEPDSELYNTGIVDVSHLFDKTYVVRPQFFVPILTLIRNSGRAAAAVRAELEAFRSSEVDLGAFEESLDRFKTAFGKNYESSSKHLLDSIERIDKTMVQLNLTREALITSERQMRLARDKADDVTLRKLAKGNETVQRLIDENRG